MAGVYGGFLEFFPELFREVMFWDAEPQLGAGYKNMTEPVPKRVILLESGKNEWMLTKKVADWIALDVANHDLVYSLPSEGEMIGLFMQHPDRTEGVYRVIQKLDYHFTGGFYIWGVERVQGAHGLNQKEVGITRGLF